MVLPCSSFYPLAPHPEVIARLPRYCPDLIPRSMLIASRREVIGPEVLAPQDRRSGPRYVDQESKALLHGERHR